MGGATGNADRNLDRVFAALADSSRRRILALLRETEALKVGDIAAAFSISLNAVSKHLKVLEGAGLVQRRVEGRTHWISADWTGLRPGLTWFEFHEHFWSGRLDQLANYIEKK